VNKSIVQKTPIDDKENCHHSLGRKDELTPSRETVTFVINQRGKLVANETHEIVRKKKRHFHQTKTIVEVEWKRNGRGSGVKFHKIETYSVVRDP
jgi:hypothetical protein